MCVRGAYIACLDGLNTFFHVVTTRLPWIELAVAFYASHVMYWSEKRAWGDCLLLKNAARQGNKITKAYLLKKHQSENGTYLG